MSIEKRRRNRIDYSIKAKLRIGSSWVVCSCRNLSMGGMLINTKHPFKENDEGIIHIEQQSGDQSLVIKASFVITRNSVKDVTGKEYESGLKFLEFFDDSSLNLYSIVRHYDAI